MKLLSLLSFCALLGIGAFKNVVKASPMIEIIISDQSTPSFDEVSPDAVGIGELIPAFIRAGLDDRTNYPSIQGEKPEHRDHFVEIQYLRNLVSPYAKKMTVETLAHFTTLANSVNNVFKISEATNNQKSRISLVDYVKTPLTHKYLCSTVVNTHDRVYQRVQLFIKALTTDHDSDLQKIGKKITELLELNKLKCP